MQIPNDLARMGFMGQDQVLRRKGQFYATTVGLYGQPSAGKTEFALGGPGLVGAVTVDRGHMGMLMNPHPPRTRNPNTLWKVIDPPMMSAATKPEFEAYWINIRDSAYRAAESSQIRTVLLDGDSDTWEVHRVAVLGRLSQVPSHMYGTVNAERRAYYARLSDAGKFLIITNKMAKEYVTTYGPDGKPELDDKGKPKRHWSGGWERKGFDDLNYSLQISLECFRTDAVRAPDGSIVSDGQFCARLELCKPNRSLEGDVLEGEDCNMQSLLRHVYPHIPLQQWGY